MKNIGLNHIPSVKGHILNLTVNLIFVAIFYVFLGGAISYLLKNLFPKFDENWERLPNLVQLADVSLEIAIIVLIAFWLTYIVHSWIPVLPVSSALEHYIESFGGQMIFVYAVFIFMENLDDKLIHVFQDIFG
jgi:membrane protein YqaA with SNARE-associated domain